MAALRLADRGTGEESRLPGVAGFRCVGYPDKDGYAYLGSCTRRGESFFGWNFNAANALFELVPAPSGGFFREPVSGSDASATLTPLGDGRYRLFVINASGLGFIDTFTWAPPPGLTITALMSSRGNVCELTADRNISCRGKLAPPKCLCDASGGTLTIVFVASGRRRIDVGGRPQEAFLGGGELRITSMTPIPYLIPSTPAKQQHGV
jgi:hypothetical protein